jgi:hypothetical protein
MQRLRYMSDQRMTTNINPLMRVMMVNSCGDLFRQDLGISYLPFKALSFTANTLLTPWSRILLEKLIITKLVKKFLAFYGTRMFIQKPATGPCPEADESTPHLPNLFPLD